MKKPDLIKICGLSTFAAVDATIAGGATHMGLIFFEKSPRNVTIDDAAELSSHAGNTLLKVAVTVDATDSFVDEIVSKVKPDLLQLHGRESTARVFELKARHGLPIIKAFPVSNQADLENAQTYAGIADLLLLDAKPPKGSELPGGNGVAFDWDIMDHWPKNVPYMLSGGLNVDNIDEALLRSGARAVDVSSGVESSPGQKDETLISAFLAKVA